MKVKITRNVKLSGKKVKIGNVVDLTDAEAKFAIARGAAVEVSAEPVEEAAHKGGKGSGKGRE